MFNVFHKCSSSSHRRRRRSKSMHELTPRYEVLEVRVVLSTYTWTGAVRIPTGRLAPIGRVVLPQRRKHLGFRVRRVSIDQHR